MECIICGETGSDYTEVYFIDYKDYCTNCLTDFIDENKRLRQALENIKKANLEGNSYGDEETTEKRSRE